MPMPAKTRAKKNLSYSKYYSWIEEGAIDGLFGDILPETNDQEDIFGMYRNKIDSVEMSILISDQGLYYLGKGSWVSIKYADIEHIYNEDGKENQDSIKLRLKNGMVVKLPIYGSEGNIRDVYAFHTYLLGVLP